MIDPTEFEYAESRWGDIYNHLKAKGFEVYSPEAKVGDCKAPYIVLRLGNTMQLDEFSSDKDTYELLVYVPRQAYSTLEPYVQSIKVAMKELRPLIRYDHNVTGSFYDDTVKAHMVTLSYYNVKKC